MRILVSVACVVASVVALVLCLAACGPQPEPEPPTQVAVIYFGGDASASAGEEVAANPCEGKNYRVKYVGNITHAGVGFGGPGLGDVLDEGARDIRSLVAVFQGECFIGGMLFYCVEGG